MLRITIYAMLIVILTMGAASAQTDAPPNIQGISGYSPMRTQQERNKDREIDRAYQSTIKGRPDAEKKKSDPWGDVRPAPPAAAKNKP
jgi:hypothetical protein